MAFEPLETDEQLVDKVQAPPDMDDQMLFGCTSFVVGSVVAYVIAAWPMFVIQETYLVKNLLLALGLGLIPCSIWGAFVTRRTGLPGACGFLGGAMAMAIFLFLRIEQLLLGYASPHLPQPDFPKSWYTIVPVSWLAFAVLIVVVLLPRKEFSDEPSPPSDRQSP